MKRILLIEDDPEIAHLLQLELGDAGFEVDWAPGGMSGLVRLREAPPDLVILDLGLPDLDGGEVARRIRVGAEERKVTLLSGGADDYIVKPFHPAELLARIQVQLRHREGGEQVTIGELEVHLSKRQVFYGGQEVRLSPKEFELLSLLCSRPGKVFSRVEIEEHLWGRSLERDSNVVDVHVANLRSKLRESGAYGYLRTVRGVGYALRQRDKE